MTSLSNGIESRHSHALVAAGSPDRSQGTVSDGSFDKKTREEMLPLLQTALSASRQFHEHATGVLFAYSQPEDLHNTFLALIKAGDLRSSDFDNPLDLAIRLVTKWSWEAFPENIIQRAFEYASEHDTSVVLNKLFRAVADQKFALKETALDYAVDAAITKGCLENVQILVRESSPFSALRAHKLAIDTLKAAACTRSEFLAAIVSQAPNITWTRKEKEELQRLADGKGKEVKAWKAAIAQLPEEARARRLSNCCCSLVVASVVWPVLGAIGYMALQHSSYQFGS